MKTLIIYDSVFGNTEKIARAIFHSLDNAEIHKANEIEPETVEGIGRLIMGSPTRAFQPTKAIKSLLKKIPPGSLEGIKVAAFDTRVSIEEVNSRLLTFLVRRFGYAAQPIADRLVKKGGELIAAPEGFIVKDTEGPLREGEMERAGDWAKKLGTG